MKNPSSKKFLYTTALCAVVFSYPLSVHADPQNGAVTAGAASISSVSGTTTIRQSTDRAIIRWDSFDVGQTEHVQFQQPSKSSITVNRIRDTKASQIDGKISATGNIILINPNGMVFGANSVVDVGGLVATSSDLDDDNAFMNGGNVKFTKPGKSDAKIINNGTMTVHNAGLAGLVAPHVENNGVIIAKMGKVQLASGDIHTIDFAGDGLIKLEVSGAVLSQSVKNTGMIDAEGGDVLLTAAQARHVVDVLVSNTGTIRANTIKTETGASKTGSIKLSTKGLENLVDRGLGQVINTGTLQASGNDIGQSGGDITVLANKIYIGDGSVVEAAGDLDGGTIKIGGDYQGGNNIPTSEMVYISQQAILNASSRRRGSGGKIIMWSDDNTRFYGHAEAKGGTESGNGGFIEISGKEALDFNGTVNLLAANGAKGTLLLDPTNITISSAANTAMTGTSPFTPTADDATSVLNISTLQTALGMGNVIVQTRATGAQLGTITVNAAITWSSGSTLTLDAHNGIIVNQAIAAGTGNLTMIAGADIALNADVSGSGILTIRQANDALTLGIAGGAGTLNLSVADLNRMLDGWSNIVIGRETSTVATTVNARVWTDNLTLKSGTGVITVAGITNMGTNNLIITTDGDIALNVTGALTGTANLTINQVSNNVGIGLGGGAGAVNLTVAEVGRIANGWNNLTFGRTDSTAAINVGALTWNDHLTLQTGSGIISITGAQAFSSNNLTIRTDANLAITANTISTGIFTLTQASDSTTMALGTGQAGNILLDTTEIGFLGSTWTNRIFGRTDGTGIINVGAITWSDPLSILSGTGAVNLNATQTMTTNSLNVTTLGGAITTGAITSTTGTQTLTSGGGNIQVNGALASTAAVNINAGGGNINIASTIGSGALTLATNAAGTIATAAAITAAGITNISTTAGAINLGSTVSSAANAMNLTTTGGSITTTGTTSGALTINSGGSITSNGVIAAGLTTLTTQGAAITINANSGSAALNITTNGGNFSTASGVILTGTGALTINTAGGTVSTAGTISAVGVSSITTGIGTINLGGNLSSGTGTLGLTTTGAAITTAGLTSAALTIASNNANISTGALTTTGAINITSGSGTISVSGTIGAAANIVNLTSTNASISTAAITSGALSLISGGGNITTNGAVTASGITTLTSGGGDISIVGNMTSGANALNVTTNGGKITNTGTVTSSLMNLSSGSGLITINNILNANAGTLIITTDSDLSLNIANALTGTGTLTIQQASAGTSIGIGDSQAGTLHLTDAEVAMIKDGWTNIILGRTDGTAALNIGALSWLDSLALQTGTGAMNINGNQTMALNNLTIRTDSDLLLDGNLISSGTGTLSILQSSAPVSMGIGDGQTGTLSLSNAELARIGASWALIQLGRTDSSGDVNVGARTWNNSLAIRSGSGQLSINGVQTMGTRNLTLSTDSDLAINANMIGTGTLSILGSNAATSIGVGTGQVGMLNISDTELNRMGTTWSLIAIGSTTQTGALNVGTRTFVDPVLFRTASGQININGNLTMGANNLTITTDSNLNLAGNITGTAILSISGSAATTTMGLGNSEIGMLHLDDSELAFIKDGWANLYFGTNLQSGALNVGTQTWNDNVLFRTSGGIISINGTQDMGANSLSITANSNIAINAALVGTGTLTISGSTAATSMGIGSGQVGIVNLNDTEIDHISDGWALIIFGLTTQTGAMNIGARTWTDAVDFRTAAGVMTISGAQNMGANNLTLRSNANIAVNNTLSGSGVLSILSTAGTSSIGVGTSAGGTVNLSDAELAQISDGWSNIIIGSTGQTAALTVVARTWTDNLELRTSSGLMTISGAQNMGANNLTILTNSNLAINGALTGSGNLTIGQTTATTTIGIGAGIGTLQLDNTELGLITNGWNQILIGTAAATGVMNVGAQTWNDNLTLLTGSGLITISGTQTMGANNLTIQTNSALAINGDLVGTGILTITPTTNSTTIGVGGAGVLNLTEAEMLRFIDGWSNIVIGRADGTGAVNVASRTWTDNVTIMSASGLMTIAGANMGANNLTLMTNSDLAVTGNLSGTGKLTIRTSSGSAGMGIGDLQTGTLNLSNAELARIVDGWGNVVMGGSAMLGAINIGGYTWVNPMTFVSQGNIIVNGIQDSTETSGTSLVYATTGGAFINNAGSNALDPGGGRYLVYSVNAANDDLDGISPSNILSNKSYAAYGPDMVIETGSIHLYSGIVNKILYLAIDDKDKAYGDAVPVFTYTYVSGLQNGDTLASIIASYTMTAIGSSVLDNAGTIRTINGSFTLNDGYSIVVETGTMTVIKQNLTVTADSDTREYGDINPALTLSYSGFKNGDDDTDIDTLASATTSATVFSNAGSYTIIGSGGVDNNYNLIYVNGTLDITKATLTATTQNATREYGLSNPALGLTYTGFKNAENQSVIDTLGSGSTVATILSDVGTYSINGVGAADNNYNFVYVNTGNLSITKATLTATTQNVSREYGLSNPALSVVYTGFRNGDLASVINTGASLSTSATILSDVGNYNITASGASDNNYNFTYANTGNLSITKAMLTATTQSVIREYGLSNPGLSIVYTGFRNGDTQSVINSLGTVSTAATILSDVGSYAVTGSGASDNNYNFIYANTGNLSITKAMLTATTQNASREYGLSNPVLNIVYTGFRNGDLASVLDTDASLSTSATILSDVGTYNITASGASDNNYNFTYANTGNLSITKAMLTATTQNVTREYGLSNPALSVVYTGFRNGDTQSVIDSLGTASTTATILSDVGAYAVTATSASDNNYDFTYANTGNLLITKATLTATTQSATREYGLSNPVLSVVYTGFRNGDTQSVINSLGTASTTATILSDVGSYSVTASGASDNNYDFAYSNTGNLLITKATLTATTQSATREYGLSNPALSVVYTGFRNGDLASVINISANLSTGATILSDVGSYAVTAAGASDNNYDFIYANTGNLSITKAMLTARTQNATREYGLSNPALNITYTGFRNSDTQTAIDTLGSVSTTATILSDVGSYAVTASGASDNNYDFTYANTGNLSITKATLTATTQNATREYGEANPALNVVYTGFRNSDDQNVIGTLANLSTAAGLLSNVGNYAVTASGATDDNYSFIYVNTGLMSVTKAALTATAQDVSKIYGNANPVLGIVYTGFKNSETQSVIDILGSASTTANLLSDVGTYTITASGASDNNYSFNYSDGTLSVGKATLTATSVSTTREYGDANPALSVAYTGFKNGQNSSIIDTLAILNTNADVLSDVGSYTITASGASDNNYDFAYVDGTLGVTKATIIATAASGAREYGDTNPVFSVSYAGFKNGQSQAVIDTLAMANSLANATSNVGNYAVSASGAIDNNYNFNYVDGAISITKATLTTTAGSGTRVYGDSNPSLGVTYTGFKNGETASVLDTQATSGSTATSTSNVGTWTVTASGGLDNNYDFVYANGSLVITKAALTVTPYNQLRETDEADPVFTIGYSGFKNGENSSVLNITPTAATNATSSSPLGDYLITASGGSDDNYSFIYSNGILSIVLDSTPPPPSPLQSEISILPSTAEKNLSDPQTIYHVLDYFKNKAFLESDDFAFMLIPEDEIYNPKRKRKYLVALTKELEAAY